VTRLTGSGNGAAVEPPGTDEPSTERTSTPGELSVLLLPLCHYGFPQRYERCVVRCSDTRSGSWALTELPLVVEPGVLWCSVWQLLSTLRCLSVCLSVCLCVCSTLSRLEFTSRSSNSLLRGGSIFNCTLYAYMIWYREQNASGKAGLGALHRVRNAVPARSSHHGGECRLPRRRW